MARGRSSRNTDRKTFVRPDFRSWSGIPDERRRVGLLGRPSSTINITSTVGWSNTRCSTVRRLAYSEPCRGLRRRWTDTDYRHVTNDVGRWLFPCVRQGDSGCVNVDLSECLVNATSNLLFFDNSLSLWGQHKLKEESNNNRKVNLFLLVSYFVKKGYMLLFWVRCVNQNNCC